MIGQWNATNHDMPKHDHHKAAGHHEEAAVGLWRVGQRAFVVRHLVTEGELSLFDTNSRMLGCEMR